MHAGMTRKAATLLSAILVAAGSLTALAAQEKKPRIAVLPFDSSRIDSSYAHLSQSVVNGMFETQLVKTGKFTVIERKRIKEVLSEQGLGLSGAVDPTTAAKVGKILGVELILTGDITELGMRKSGGGSSMFGGSKTTLEGSLDIRLISTTSAEIVFADTSKHEDSNYKVRAFGVGGGVDFDETSIEKVFRPCVKDLTEEMAAKAGEIVGTMRGGGGLEGKIASVAGGKIYINKGGNEGVKVGDVFEVYRPGNEIRDPDTGAVLDVEEKLIGKIIVTEVKDKLSIASAQSGSGFLTGDVVRPPS
ncbi:MAG TPA: CsgG/HfaB family protein [Candidatus Saccharimonadales bacterium]|nr:CsgG/HfaB family protein [Candidatus Saccharimonadales bacterium]